MSVSFEASEHRHDEEPEAALRGLVAGAGGALLEAITTLVNQRGIRAAHIEIEQLELTLARHRPEWVLFDGRLESGILTALIKIARRRAPGVRVLVLDGADATGPLKADGYVTGWSTVQELLAAIAGSAPHAGTRARQPEDRARRGQITQLTSREVQILRTLMAGASNAAVAERLGISPNTVRTHVQNILGKLDVSSRLQAVMLGFRAGLRPFSELESPEREVS